MSVDAWDEPTEPDAEEQSATESDAAVPQLFYGSVEEFVREHLVYHYVRIVGRRSTSSSWAPKWWQYPEVISRLEALWRAWEALRLDPAFGMSVWWRDHVDHHMRVILDPDGPFSGTPAADLAENKPGERLPLEPAPNGWFPDLREPVKPVADQ